MEGLKDLSDYLRDMLQKEIDNSQQFEVIILKPGEKVKMEMFMIPDNN